METDYIYWKHLTPCGIRVEEISGREDKSGAIWLAMARQIWEENGEGGWQELDHTAQGAPLLVGSQQRVSVSHTEGLLVVATLPRTPEASLTEFSQRTAMGIDCERADRTQVLRVRERFLSEDELQLVPADDVEKNIIAWTAKEALLKASLRPDIDIRRGLRILSLPEPGEPVMLKGSGPFTPAKALITYTDGAEIPMNLYCYRSEAFIVTLAYSPKCATFKKG